MFRGKSKNDTTSSGNNVPFFAGFAAGVVAGLLFAPDKGSATRKNLKNKVTTLLDELKDTNTYNEITSTPQVKTVVKKINNTQKKAQEISDLVEKNTKKVSSAPITKATVKATKKVTKAIKKDVKSTINKKTGKKFIARKK